MLKLPDLVLKLDQQHQKLLAEGHDPKELADAMLTVAAAAKVRAFGALDTCRHLWAIAREFGNIARANGEACAVTESAKIPRARFN